MLKPNFTDKLESCIKKHMDVSLKAIKLSPITSGKFNTSYYVSTGNDEFVLRIAPSDDTFCLFYERQMMKQEPGLHELLREKTTIPIPRILVYDRTRDIIDRDYLIMERMAGTPMSEAWGMDTTKILSQTGEYLSQAHALAADTYGYIGEHHPMKPQHNWADAFAIMWKKLIDDVAATGHYSKAEESHLRQLLDEHMHCFDRPVKASLLHMDVWAQNILVDQNSNITGLIDWDRALWGDPEIEFAVLDYTGVSEPAFWQGYGQKRDRSPEAQIRQVFYFLYELQKYIPIRHFRGHNPDTARTYKDQVMHIVANAFD